MNQTPNPIKSLLAAILISCICFCGNSTQAQSNSNLGDDNKMEWFGNAKLGIFIHWGLYSVNGIDESWSFYNEYISHKNYLKQTKGFTASNYKPEEWVSLIKGAGARYAVITAKHHDGFAMWDTKYGNFNIRNSAAKKDLIAPL